MVTLLTVGLSYYYGKNRTNDFLSLEIDEGVRRVRKEKQKQRWLPVLAKGEAIGCFGLTEPDFGSNPAGMLTTAKRDGDDWILDGRKMWITNGTISDVSIVWARTEEGIRGFLVEAGTPGFSAPEQKKKWDAAVLPRNKAFLADPPTGKDLVRWKYQRYIKNYLRCVKAVDENIGRMLKYLDVTGQAKNTVVIYSSDQGFWLGEHGWFDKRWMYEESLHTPLLVRWPGHIKPGSTNANLVSNLDFAQTFLEIAGAPQPKDMQGRSLTSILRGQTPKDWRKTHYYHYYEAGGHGVPIHYGVTDGRYKLIRFPGDKLNTWEFFDLKTDPQEMKSRYTDSKYAGTIAGLKQELTRLRKHYQVKD